MAKFKVHDLEKVEINGKSYLLVGKPIKNDINGNGRYELNIIDVERKAILTRNVTCYKHELPYYASKLVEDWEAM